MWRRLLILDVALVGVLVGGGIKFRRNWLEFEDKHRVESVQAEPETPRTITATGAAAAGVGDWTEIVSKNPFSFDRNDIAIVAPPPPPPTPAPEAPRAGPKPVLFGTFGIGQDWQAMLASGQPGNRKSRPMKIGESIDNWQILEIRKDSVVVASGALRETIPIDTGVQTRVAERTAIATPAPIQPPPAAPQPGSPTASATPPAKSVPSCVPDENPSGKGHILETPFGKKCIEDK
jgi:hypothetical protein